MSVRHVINGTQEDHIVETGTVTPDMLGDASGGVINGPLVFYMPAGWSLFYTLAHTSPVSGGYQTPLVFDDTASTGGLYIWNGSDYALVGLATS